MIKGMVNEILNKYGMREDLNGRLYLHYILSKKISLQKMEDVYEQISNEFDSTRSRVERAIRYCIANSQLKGNNNKTVIRKLHFELYFK